MVPTLCLEECVGDVGRIVHAETDADDQIRTRHRVDGQAWKKMAIIIKNMSSHVFPGIWSPPERMKYTLAGFIILSTHFLCAVEKKGRGDKSFTTKLAVVRKLL